MGQPRDTNEWNYGRDVLQPSEIIIYSTEARLIRPSGLLFAPWDFLNLRSRDLFFAHFVCRSIWHIFWHSF